MTKFGDVEKVVAYPGGVKRAGFVLRGPHVNDAGEEKFTIQIGNEEQELGYREPPYGPEGKGGTFRKVRG